MGSGCTKIPSQINLDEMNSHTTSSSHLGWTRTNKGYLNTTPTRRRQD